MSLLHLSILLPFAGSACVLLTRKWRTLPHAGWLAFPIPLLLFVYFCSQIASVQSAPTTASIPWLPFIDISFAVYLDGLSLLFSLLISGIGALVTLYSIFYMDRTKEDVHSFYSYLLLFMGAMLGVVLSDNLMVLYGFWELTSIASFLLIGFWHHRDRSRYGAQKSLLITVFGGLAMFAGFVLLYVMAGTFSVREIIAQLGSLQGDALFVPSLVLVLLGACTKSAQFPFHIWLPDAMEAPTPVSAYLHSATMVKAGLYLVARLSPIYAAEALWFWIVTTTGMITLIYGSYQAIKQKDLKAMLAFSTISQLGLVMCLLGLGSASAFFADTATALFFAKATTAGLLHLLNHALFKGALFMVVGIIDHETGTRDIRKLGGLMTIMPVTFTVALLGTASMAGLPPLGGFISKEMFFTSVVQIQQLGLWNMKGWGLIIPAIAWVASVFTFTYSMLLLVNTFGGKLKPDKLETQPHEAPAGMLAAPVILGLLALMAGLFPNVLGGSLVAPAMAAIHPYLLAAGEQYEVQLSLWHGLTAEVWMTLGVVAAGSAIVWLYRRRRLEYKDWMLLLDLNRWYDKGLERLHSASSKVTGLYMTGSLRAYLLYIFLFIAASLGITMLATYGLPRQMDDLAPISIYEAAVAIGLALLALAIPLLRGRVAAILATGGVGYLVTLLFVLYRAPDLALTQMIIETVSVALFLLCFYHLPKRSMEKPTRSFRFTNALIAGAVGLIVTLLAIGASDARPFASISDFFIAESYRLAGGSNMVNVILVDFRGFDTMLEITVLGIASLGIYAMIRQRLDEQRAAGAVGQSGNGAGRYIRLPDRSNDVILKTVSKVAIFIIVAFSLYLFFAGHNSPGGGFIGGLMTSAAIVLLALAFGLDVIEQVLPIDFTRLTAAGLLIAVVTGAGSFVLGAPFLSHAFGHFYLPLLGDTELATAVIFDLGVYLAVVGVTMTIILSIGREK